MGSKTILDYRQIPTLPTLPEIDDDWIQLEEFFERNHYQDITEKQFFKACDLAVRMQAAPITPIVLTQNSQEKLCLNPQLVPMIKFCLDTMLDRTFQKKSNGKSKTIK